MHVCIFHFIPFMSSCALVVIIEKIFSCGYFAPRNPVKTGFQTFFASSTTFFCFGEG